MLHGDMTSNKNDHKKAAPIIIKKYVNRRLYNTAISCTVTFNHLIQMVKDEEEFVVIDTKTNRDVTKEVLIQIILQQENKGQAMLSINLLRQLISDSGKSQQKTIYYLEQAMQFFVWNQEQIRKKLVP